MKTYKGTIKRIVACAASAALAAALCVGPAATALAADDESGETSASSGNSTTYAESPGNTDVTIVYADEGDNEDGTEADPTTGENSNVAFSVPTVIAFTMSSDGTLTGPDASSELITSLSVIPIHVTSAYTEAASGYVLVEDATDTSEDDAIEFQYGANTEIDAYASYLNGDPGTVVTSTDGESDDYDMDACGETIEISSAGQAANLTSVPTSATSVATITWYVAANTGNVYEVS